MISFVQSAQLNICIEPNNLPLWKNVFINAAASQHGYKAKSDGEVGE